MLKISKNVDYRVIGYVDNEYIGERKVNGKDIFMFLHKMFYNDIGSMIVNENNLQFYYREDGMNQNSVITIEESE